MNDPYGLLASGLPPELAAQAMGLTRQQAIAQALMQQSLQGPPSPQNKGRIESKASWLGPIAQMVQAGLGTYMQRQNDAKAAELSSKQREGVANAMMEYQKRFQGTPSYPSPPDELGGGPAAPAVPGDRRAAIVAALADPYLKGNPMVAADIKAMEKGQEPFSLKPGEKRYQGSQVTAENAPKPERHVINGKVYEIRDGKAIEVGGPGDPMAFNRPFNADGTPNKDYQNYELMKANQGATKVQTLVNSFTPASEEAQRDFMKSTRATYDQLKQAPVLLESLEKAKQLIPSAKGFMGPGGEGLLTAAKFLNNRLGTSIDTEGVKSAEELRTRIFFNIMDNLKKMDAQPSQQQQQIMQEALGRLGTDPNAMPAVLNAFGDVIKGKVDLHNKEVAGAAAKGVKFPYDPTIKLPNTVAAEETRSLGGKTYVKRDGQWYEQ